MNHEYPYTQFAGDSCNPFILACKRAGVKLAVVGDSLQLLDRCNFVLSQVKINQATIALQDEHGHNLDDYVYNIIIRDGSLVFIDGNGNETVLTLPKVNEATHAEEADYAFEADVATLAKRAEIATTAENAINATEAAHADSADYAISAGQATTAQIAASANHAQTADNATNAANAINAVRAQNADVATKAEKDMSGNVITASYVANVTVDTTSGEIKFYAKNGSLITSITPVAQIAVMDENGNRISDYVKSVVISEQNDYMLVKHGDGTSDTYYVNYSNKAWKDTAGNIIKNVYAKVLRIEYDPDTNEPWLVYYNGEGSEIGRLQIVAVRAHYADYAEEAVHAINADTATDATHAATADEATHAYNADYVREAAYAVNAGTAENANYASSAGNASNATNAVRAQNADVAAKAELDIYGNNLVDYLYAIIVRNDQVLLIDGHGNESILTIPKVNDAYHADEADHATNADVADTALYAYKDMNGNIIRQSYANKLTWDPDTKELSLVAHDGTVLSTIILT